MEINVEEFLNYLKYHKSYRDYLFVRLLIETNLKVNDVLTLKTCEAKGKIDIRGERIGLDLSQEITKYAHFKHNDGYLFESKRGNQMSLDSIWRVFNRSYQELGYEGKINFTLLKKAYIDTYK